MYRTTFVKRVHAEQKTTRQVKKISSGIAFLYGYVKGVTATVACCYFCQMYEEDAVDDSIYCRSLRKYRNFNTRCTDHANFRQPSIYSDKYGHSYNKFPTLNCKRSGRNVPGIQNNSRITDAYPWIPQQNRSVSTTPAYTKAMRREDQHMCFFAFRNNMKPVLNRMQTSNPNIYTYRKQNSSLGG